MKSDPRIEESKKSVIGLSVFLTAIIKDPTSFQKDVTVLNGIRSQGSLAKLNLPDYGVRPTSLNTIKRACAREFDEGFSKLEALRKSAISILNSHKTQKTALESKRRLKQRITILENELQQALQDAWNLTLVFERALSQGQYYAEQASDPAVLELSKRNQRELRQVFSLCRQRIVPKDG